MLLIVCPWCGTRDEDEFNYGGVLEKRRPLDSMALTDEAWAQYLFQEENVRGQALEKWRHTFGCRQWFVCERYTVSHQITRVMRLEDARAEEESRISSATAEKVGP